MRTTLAVLLVLVSTRCATTRPADPGRSTRELLERYESYGFSGTVLVAKDDRIVLHEGYGFADRERGIRNDRQSLFEWASIAKTFTAAGILLLESRGALRTSDPLSRHLGPFPGVKAGATIDHVATHTAGLVPEGADLGNGEDREDYIENVKRVPAESAPGERFRYSNAAFSTLAAIIEKISGQSFESFVREQLAARANLREIYFRGEALPRPIANGYVGPPAEARVNIPPPYRWSTRGSGGMITTVGEIYRWHRALHAGQIINDTELRKMFAEGRPEEGYAWTVERDANGRRVIRKGGGATEYATQIIYYPDDRLVIIWASNNLQQRWRQALNRGIAAVAFGQAPVMPPPRLMQAIPQSLTGTYVTESGKRLELASNGEFLYARENDLDVPSIVPFFPTAEREFTGFDPTRVTLMRMTFDGGVVRVTTTADGEVVARKTP